MEGHHNQKLPCNHVAEDWPKQRWKQIGDCRLLAMTIWVVAQIGGASMLQDQVTICEEVAVDEDGKHKRQFSQR